MSFVVGYNFGPGGNIEAISTAAADARLPNFREVEWENIFGAVRGKKLFRIAESLRDESTEVRRSHRDDEILVLAAIADSIEE